MKKLLIVALIMWVSVGIVFAGDYIKFVDGDKPQTGKLMIAVESFTKQGVQVDLYGVVHMADRSYYRKVQRDLNSYDVVLYEGIKQGDKPNKETQVLNLFQLGMAKVFGFQFQKTGIDYTGKNFVHADIDAAALKRGMKGEKLTPIEGLGITKEQMGLFKPFLLKAGVYMEMYFMQNPEVRRNLKYTFGKQLANTDIEKQLSPQMRKAIIIDRNQIVMNVLSVQIKDLRKDKFAIFYGAGHNPDFAKRLLAKGWKKGPKRWMVAWNIR